MTFQNIEKPAEIAAAVRRPAALQSAEMRFATANKRHAEATAEQRAIIAAAYGKDDPAAAREIRKLDAELTALNEKLRPLAAELHGLRTTRAAAVFEALAPTRRRVAERALAVIGELRECISVIDECGEQFSRAGGGDGFEIPVLTAFVHGALQSIEIAARKIVDAAQ